MNKEVIEKALLDGKIAITPSTLIRLRAINDMNEVYGKFMDSFDNTAREDEAYDNIAAKYYDLIESMKAEIFTEIMDNLESRVFCGI